MQQKIRNNWKREHIMFAQIIHFGNKIIPTISKDLSNTDVDNVIFLLYTFVC